MDKDVSWRHVSYLYLLQEFNGYDHSFSGNAALSPDEAILLVDNLSTGTFDLYRFPATVPSTSFPLMSTRCITKQCVFAESGKVAICGSDHDTVYVVDLATSQLHQSLRSDSGESLMTSLIISQILT